jgi:hypothetical protein
MRSNRLPHRSRPTLRWRMLDVLAGQVRAAAAAAGFPAVVLPDRSIAAGVDAWDTFLETADWTTLKNAQTALVRLRS